MQKLPTKLFKRDTREPNSLASKLKTNPVQEVIHLAEKALDDQGYFIAIAILDRAIEANVDNPELVSELVTARAKVYIMMNAKEYALEELDYLIELQPDNEDAKTARELLINKIDYAKKVTAFPLYS